MESNKPKVLVFTDWYLPGYKAGGPISSVANLVAALGDSIAFTIVCSDRDYLDARPYPGIVIDQGVKQGNAEVIYLSPGKQSFGTIRQLIIDHSDAEIYINGIFSKTFSIFPLLAAHRLKRESILAPRGMLAPGALGIKNTKKKIYLAFANTFKLFSGVCFHATNSRETEQIRNTISKFYGIITIPNLPTIPASEVVLPQKEPDAIRIISVARIAREKNTLFAIRVLQSLPKDLKVKIELVGPVYGAEYFDKCKAAAQKLPSNVDIKFPGPKPPGEIGKLLINSHLFFSPTLGENYGHAIVEAMLSGTPVLISDQTPWHNLEETNAGAEFSLQNPGAFTRFIESVARMDSGDYVEKFKDIAPEAANRINLNDSIEKYKRLFK